MLENTKSIVNMLGSIDAIIANASQKDIPSSEKVWIFMLNTSTLYLELTKAVISVSSSGYLQELKAPKGESEYAEWTESIKSVLRNIDTAKKKISDFALGSNMGAVNGFTWLYVAPLHDLFEVICKFEGEIKRSTHIWSCEDVDSELDF